ncbi:hypothetical protein GCM10009775_03660 [Microbacterium aoyamense]|uniref:Lipoprotein n=1 Tax=Microbacterium aoyamense TaxID=344166 RepID=A0ABN2P877_9MICO|nr:hypothetical protein [Microbacterium aoyamense]
MFHTNSRNRMSAVALMVVVGLGSLTACQTLPNRGDLPDPQPGPVVEGERAGQGAAQHGGLPADRIAEALERRAAEHRALSERFAGVPADRIEEQLARERDE